MFFEKLALGGIGGGVLGIVMAIVTLFRGQSFSEAGEMFMGCICLGLIAVFWFGRGSESQNYSSADHEVADLHAQLQRAHHAIGMYEQDGQYSKVSHWRSEVARIESELRRRGA